MGTSKKYDFDLVVIGSGASGAVAAEIIAAKGKSVAVIESSMMGGYAPNFGDIPRRAALESAHQFANFKTVSKLGLRTHAVGYNFPAIREWKNTVIQRSGASRIADYLKARNIQVFRGRAHFISQNEISLSAPTGRTRISGRKFLIATGASEYIPKIIGLEEMDYLTESSALELNRPPKSLAIIGAGTAGVELAEFFAIFGAKVHLIEQKSRIVSKYDPEVSEFISREFINKYGIKISTSANITNIKKDSLLTSINYVHEGNKKTLKVDKILIACGSAPNVDIGLTSAGVNFDDRGVKVDDELCTSAKNIFAAGSVISRNQQENIDASSAMHQSSISAWNMYHRNKKTAFMLPKPKIIATNPVIASVGLTEEKLIKNRLKYRKITIMNSSTTKANISNETSGFTKILVGSKGEILGATIASPVANESIALVSLAMKNNLTTDELAQTILPFGSWNEALKMALIEAS